MHAHTVVMLSDFSSDIVVPDLVSVPVKSVIFQGDSPRRPKISRFSTDSPQNKSEKNPKFYLFGRDKYTKTMPINM